MMIKDISIIIALIGLTFVGANAGTVTKTAPVTTNPPTPEVQILNGHYRYLFVVRPKGCYKIHADKNLYNVFLHGGHSHPEQTTLISMIEKAAEVHEIDHHLIDREPSNVQTLCQDLPIFVIPHATVVGK